MKYPLTLSSHKRIVYIPEGWFEPIGKLCIEKMELEIGISNLGEAGLEWLIDYNGRFYELNWLSKRPKTLLNFIGFKKQREVYSISSARDISVEELKSLIGSYTNQFNEAPDTAMLKNILSKKPITETVTSDIFKELYGEKENA